MDTFLRGGVRATERDDHTGQEEFDSPLPLSRTTAGPVVIGEVPTLAHEVCTTRVSDSVSASASAMREIMREIGWEMKQDEEKKGCVSARGMTLAPAAVHAVAAAHRE